MIINQEEDLCVCGGAASVEEALQVLQKQMPDVLIVDLSLKDSSGLDLIKQLRDAGCRVPVLVLSMHDEMLYAERALRAGANGYIMKEQAEDALIEGIRMVLQGRLYVSDAIQEHMLQQYIGGREGGVQLLSNRELQVFEMIGTGISTQQIADQLQLSVKTVEAHRAHIKKKLQITSAAQLVQQAVRWVEQQR